MLRVSGVQVTMSASTLPNPIKQRPIWIAFEWINGGTFGQVVLQIVGGNVEIYSEKMGKDFVKKLLCNMIDDGTLLE